MAADLWYTWFKQVNGGARNTEENAGTPQIERLSAAFAACAKILTAIGDETRQHLILEMIRMGDCRSVRVGKITEKTNLSRLLFASSFALVLSLYHF